MSPLSSVAFYDPQRYRAEVAYFDELRAAFNDPLPIHSYAPYHPLMDKGDHAGNVAKQTAVLQAIETYQAEEAKRGEEMAHQFEAANPPKPGDPGYKPTQPGQPGQPRPSQPGQPGYNPPPGQPGHDPSQPHDPNDPNAPQPTHSE